MIRNWLREPLLHFLLAGGAIYLALVWWGNPVDPADRTVSLSRERQAGIALSFERTMGRSPTDAEMDGLIDRWIRDEILYREALRLGLDKDDAVVRRRLATKMEEIATAKVETAAVSDQTLQNWLNQHPARFAKGASVTFDQAWFPQERAARAALAQGNPRGEPISLPRSVSRMHLSEVQAVFGQKFAAQLEQVQVAADWQGPVQSGFGWHLVRLNERTRGELPALENVRDEVEADWRNATIAERRKRAFEVLRQAYTVERE